MSSQPPVTASEPGAIFRQGSKETAVHTLSTRTPELQEEGQANTAYVSEIEDVAGHGGTSASGSGTPPLRLSPAPVRDDGHETVETSRILNLQEGNDSRTNSKPVSTRDPSETNSRVVAKFKPALRTMNTFDNLRDTLEEKRLRNLKEHRGPLHKIAWYVEVATFLSFSASMLVILGFWIAFHAQAKVFVVTFFVTTIAAVAYLLKSCHLGDIEIKGNLVPIARYVDWITTTPLMLFELCLLADSKLGTYIMVIGCDLLMLSCGIMAAVLNGRYHWYLKNVLFCFACFYFVIMVATLHVDGLQEADRQETHVKLLFERLEVLTVVTWSFYPIVVFLGRAHLGLISRAMEDILLCGLDLLSKVGMDGMIVITCLDGCIEEK